MTTCKTSMTKTVPCKQRDCWVMKYRSRQAVPLIKRKHKIGWLTITRRRPGIYAQHGTRRTFALTQQERVAPGNTELYEQALESAVLQERQHLARELHDSVTQELYGICLAAATARETLETEPVEAMARVEHVIQHAETGLAEMRALLFELRPASLETEGLITALRKQVAMLRSRYRLNVEAELGGEPGLSIERRQSLYRVAQEALRNVVKHAHASVVTLRLIQEGHDLLLEVRDDGHGFDLNSRYPGHMGLQSMQERVHSLRGTFTITSAPGKGTAISVRLPIYDGDQQEKN